MSLRVGCWLTSLCMFPHHSGDFLLPLSSLPSLLFLSIYGSVEMKWVSFQKKPRPCATAGGRVRLCVFTLNDCIGLNNQYNTVGQTGQQRCKCVKRVCVWRGRATTASASNSRGRRGAAPVLSPPLSHWQGQQRSRVGYKLLLQPSTAPSTTTVFEVKIWSKQAFILQVSSSIFLWKPSYIFKAISPTFNSSSSPVCVQN